jgi:hypothetical protein
MSHPIRWRRLAGLAAGLAIVAAALISGSPAGAAPAGAAAAAAPAAGPTLTFRGTFVFEARSGSGIDALSTNAVFPQPGPAAVSAKPTSTGKQWNMFIPSNSSGVLLKNTTAGLCLDGNSGGNGAIVTANACDDVAPFDSSQLWIIASVPGTNFTYFTMQNKLTGRYLTAVGTSHVEVRNFSSGNFAQQWKMTQVCC